MTHARILQELLITIVIDSLKLLQAAIAKRLISEHGMQAEDIAAITPYSAQKEEIKKQLKRLKLEAVVVKTITDAQGNKIYYSYLVICN